MGWTAASRRGPCGVRVTSEGDGCGAGAGVGVPAPASTWDTTDDVAEGSWDWDG